MALLLPATAALLLPATAALAWLGLAVPLALLASHLLRRSSRSR